MRFMFRSNFTYIKRWVLEHRDYLFFFIFYVFSWMMMSHTLGYKDGQIIIAGKIYSDFAAHIPLIRSFSLGSNFPPEYPMFPGEPIRYHYLFYLFVGLLERAGFNLAMATNILSSLGFSFLLYMIYSYGKLFFKKSSAGFLAVVLFLFNGSLSFIEFFIKNPLSINSFYEITTATSYSSFGPWDGKIVSAFWNLNIYTNQRHLALSFALVLLLLWPLVKNAIDHSYKISKINHFFILLLFCLFPLLHQAGYAILIITAGLWILLNRDIDKTLVKVYSLSLVLSLFVFFSFYQNGGGHIIWKVGFLAKDSSLFQILYYWISNMGLYFLLLPFILFFSKGPYKKFILILYVLFILANCFQLSSDMINNHKLINFFMIGMNIGVAGYILKFFSKNIWAKFVSLILLVIMTLSGVLDIFPLKNDNSYYLIDYPKSNLISWIVNNTPPGSVFLTTTYLYNPASIAGRKIYLDYGYFAWSLGYNDNLRRRKLPFLFSNQNNKKNICSLLEKEKIDYIIVSPGKGELDKIDIKISIIATEFIKKHESIDGYTIYSYKDNCN